MTIRIATQEDAIKIKDLAEKLKLNSSSQGSKGFLVYVLDEAGYQERISNNPYFLVSENSMGINGFFMAYSDQKFLDLVERRLVDPEDGYPRFLLSQRRPFIIGDQIAVRPDLIGSGIGARLMKTALRQIEKDRIPSVYVDILHSPQRNLASIAFCTRVGFRQTDEVQNKDGLVWDIYKAEIEIPN